MDTSGLSLICSGLGAIEEGEEGSWVRYSKGEYCLRMNLSIAFSFFFFFKWNIVFKDMVPIIEHYHKDRSMLTYIFNLLHKMEFFMKKKLIFIPKLYSFRLLLDDVVDSDTYTNAYFLSLISLIIYLKNYENLIF